MKNFKKYLHALPILFLIIVLSLNSVSAVDPSSRIWGVSPPTDGTYYLSGTAIGSEATKDDRTSEKAFDNITQTYFEALADEGGQWCGLQFDTPYVITEIRLFPRLGNPEKLFGGSFEVSTDGKNWISIYEIPQTIKSDFSSFEVLYPYPVSYVRYINYSVRAIISEIEIYGVTPEEAKTNETVLNIIEKLRPNIHTLSSFGTIDTAVFIFVLAAICTGGIVFIKKITKTQEGERQK